MFLPMWEKAASSPTHSPLPLSALSQAREFPAILLGEALIYLFNGESKQQLEKSGFSDQLLRATGPTPPNARDLPALGPQEWRRED